MLVLYFDGGWADSCYRNILPKDRNLNTATPLQRPAWQRYVVALLTLAAATGFTFLLFDYTQRTVFIFYFGAVIFIAWFGGLAPGLLASALSVLLADFLFIQPRYQLLLRPVDLVPAGIFLLFAGMASALSENLRSARRHAEQREAEAAALARQLEDQAIELEQQTVELEMQYEEAQVLAADLENANRLLSRRSRELLAEAERIGHMGSWEWDAQNNRVLWSDEMFRIYGYQPGAIEVSFDRFLEMVHPSDRDLVEQTVTGAFQSEKPFEFRYRIVRPDGSERVLQARGRVDRDEQGKPSRMLGTGQDITEQVAAEQARIQLQEERSARMEAEASNQAKFEFLTRMSHELRTPLNAIAGYAQLLDLGVNGPLTDGQRQSIARITRNQQHLLGLINDVLNYAKLETGHVTLHITEFPVQQLFDELDPLIGPQLAARSLRYSQAPAPPELRTSADFEKALQVLVNLLANAVKFTDDGGQISVTAEAVGDRIATRVKDTGVGIARDKLEIIFDPFTQVNMSYTRTREGTGLGLSISRDLARSMGGDVTVESIPGVGSTFTFWLPRAHC